MNKLPVSPSWFEQLHTVDLEYHFKWLAQLSGTVESIVDFGCWNSSEPFALLWAVDATQVKVIEKEEKNLAEPREELERLRNINLGCLEGRSVEFVVADMSSMVAELPSDHFDLAYCENVLYFMQSDLPKVQEAINEMARVVRPGGWVIAIETKIGAKFEEVVDEFASKLFGHTQTRFVRVSDPMDISELFRIARLVHYGLDGAPDWSYCYKKPSVPDATG